jgi:hypothetical protein
LIVAIESLSSQDLATRAEPHRQRTRVARTVVIRSRPILA